MFEKEHFKYMRWYHWFLYPFSRKFLSVDGRITIYGFEFLGKFFIFKKVEAKELKDET